MKKMPLGDMFCSVYIDVVFLLCVGEIQVEREEKINRKDESLGKNLIFRKVLTSYCVKVIAQYLLLLIPSLYDYQKTMETSVVTNMSCWQWKSAVIH